MRNWIWRIQQLLRGSGRRARLRAGLVSDAVESSREELGFAWLDGTAADFRHAFRALVRSRGFAVVAVLVIAMSVAINTLIFCMFDGVVLRPLPYAAPERLVRLFDVTAIGRYLDYRARAASPAR